MRRELSDKCLVVLMAARLGHVTRARVSYRGTRIETWVLNGEDVGREVSRLILIGELAHRKKNRKAWVE
jgi:hypothetical protein